MTLTGDKKAAEKTSQALREKATEEGEKIQEETPGGGAGILVPSPASYLAATTASVMGNILASGTYTGSVDKKDNVETPIVSEQKDEGSMDVAMELAKASDEKLVDQDDFEVEV